MKKIWFVAAQEFQRNAFKKSFILVLLSVPILIVFNIGIGFFLESLKDNPLPVGYVDHAGIFSEDAVSPDMRSKWRAEYGEPVDFISFPTSQEALEALNTKSIQAYYVLPDDYLETRKISLFYSKEPGKNASRQFYDLLQINLLSSKTPEIAYRAASGTDVTVRSIDRHREVPNSGPTFGFLMPLFISMAFLFLLLMSSGYVMGSVADEKENRTMEVLITSIKPSELIAGKILGIAAIGLTLLFTWSVVITSGVLIGRGIGIAWLADTSLDWRVILSTIVIALPAYVLSISLMTTIGSIVTSTQEGQSLSAVFVILHMLPLYVSWTFLNEPHGTLPVILSFLPFTALMTVGMRNIFTIVPTWQVIVSAIIQTVCAAGAVWIAGRAFRLGILRYGQRLQFSKLFRIQRG
jgi:ABC-2 type transport system permease protein